MLDLLATGWREQSSTAEPAPVMVTLDAELVPGREEVTVPVVEAADRLIAQYGVQTSAAARLRTLAAHLAGGGTLASLQRPLRGWMNQQRHKVRAGVPPRVAPVLDVMVPGWSHEQERREDAAVRLGDLGAVRSVHLAEYVAACTAAGRPIEGGSLPADAPEELRRWVYACRETEAARTVDTAQNQILDRVLPGWRGQHVPHEHPRAGVTEQVVQLAGQGLTLAQIADQVGVTPARASLIVRRHRTNLERPLTRARPGIGRYRDDGIGRVDGEHVDAIADALHAGASVQDAVHGHGDWLWRVRNRPAKQPGPTPLTRRLDDLLPGWRTSPEGPRYRDDGIGRVDGEHIDAIADALAAGARAKDAVRGHGDWLSRVRNRAAKQPGPTPLTRRLDDLLPGWRTPNTRPHHIKNAGNKPTDKKSAAERDARILAMLESGLTPPRVAERLGVSPQRAYVLCARARDRAPDPTVTEPSPTAAEPASTTAEAATSGHATTPTAGMDEAAPPPAPATPDVAGEPARTGGRTCEVPGCDRPYVAGGLCRMHYSRKRNGRPLVQERPEIGSPSGHGRYGVLDDDGSTVACHECGDRRRALGSHLRADHAMTAREYKLKHGLPLSKGLTSAEYAAERSEHARAQVGTPAWQRLEAARDPEAASHARDAESFRSPAIVRVSAAKGAALSVKNRGPASVPCRECGAPIPTQVGRSPRQLCDDCLPEQQSQASRQSWAATAPERAARNAAMVAGWLAGASQLELGREYGISHRRVGQVTTSWRDELRRRVLYPDLEVDPTLAAEDPRRDRAILARPWWHLVWEKLPGPSTDRDAVRAIVEHTTGGHGLTTLTGATRAWLTGHADTPTGSAPDLLSVLDRLVPDWRPITRTLTR